MFSFMTRQFTNQYIDFSLEIWEKDILYAKRNEITLRQNSVLHQDTNLHRNITMQDHWFDPSVTGNGGEEPYTNLFLINLKGKNAQLSSFEPTITLSLVLETDHY